MQSDDDLQTTLSKWPFILGDLLLVGTALSIAILGDWQLTNWQVASCVLSVALGAGLYTLPYLVEYRVRIREESEDRSAELNVLRRQFAAAETALEAVDERVQALASEVDTLAQSATGPTVSADLTASVETLEAKLAPLADAGAAQQAELDALGKRVAELSESMDSGPDTPVVTPFPDMGSGLNVDHKVSVSRPVRSPRRRRSVEPRLLQRAIEQKQDNASAAVSRIIGGKTKEAASPQASQGKRPKKPGTAVIASVFIGIGNKPYLRGSAGGLSWEQGVAMEFEAIGKWLWVGPEDLKKPVEIQVYRNDEDPDHNGKYTLTPGKKLEISPEF